MIRDVATALGGTAAVYLGLLGYRTDAAGHALAGLGGTLLLLGALLAAARAPVGWSVVGAVLLAVAGGVVTEATIFKLAVFDMVDFANQSIGACLAGLCALGRCGKGDANVAYGGAVVGLVAGTFLAFA